MTLTLLFRSLAVLAASCAVAVGCGATEASTGRWDLQATSAAFSYPCWIEISGAGAGGETAVRYVGRVGTVKPIKRVEFDGDTLVFTENEWFGTYETVKHDLRFSGDTASGTFTRADGQTLAVTGRRAPPLDRAAPATWSSPRALFNGRDLAGWRAAKGDKPPAHWLARDGELVLLRAGPPLRTEETFDDFTLRAEFNCPAGGNTGIYLRGRYELQIEEEAAVVPADRQTGAIYGFLGAATPPPRRPGEWRTLAVTLVGRRVTVVLDGATLYAEREIPGLTGEALDSDEAAPSPVVLQASHKPGAGEIRFRHLTIATPLAPASPPSAP